jgi:WXXGXW repeat (2 copies)
MRDADLGPSGIAVAKVLKSFGPAFAEEPYFYAPGYWRWAGREYVWAPGHWASRHEGYEYAHPHWEAENGRGVRRGWGWVRHDESWNPRYQTWSQQGDVWVHRAAVDEWGRRGEREGWGRRAEGRGEPRGEGRAELRGRMEPRGHARASWRRPQYRAYQGKPAVSSEPACGMMRGE